MKPSRNTKPSTHHPPTSIATNEVRPTMWSVSITTGATAAAVMRATVDSAPMFRSRQVPNTAYTARAAAAV